MNKRQARIEALELANDILIGSTTTLETEFDNIDHYKVIVELERIAASLGNRALRLRLRDRDAGAGR